MKKVCHTQFQICHCICLMSPDIVFFTCISVFTKNKRGKKKKKISNLPDKTWQSLEMLFKSAGSLEMQENLGKSEKNILFVKLFTI